MKVTVTLLLAGVLGTEARGSALWASSDRSAGGARSATSSDAFRIEPLAPLGRPVGYALQAFRILTAGPSSRLREDAGATSAGIVQLQSHRTGVTCTMRILQVKTNLDPGIVAPASGPKPDAMVRNSSSPCLD